MKFVSLDKFERAVDLLKARITNRVLRSGDTMTGNLSVPSLKFTGSIASSSEGASWCVLQDNYINTRTTSQVKQDLGIPEVVEKTISLGTSWSGSAAPYSQAVTVSGLLATDNPTLDIVPTLSGYSDEESNWAKIFKAVTTADTLTFYAKDKTTMTLSIKLKVVR